MSDIAIRVENLSKLYKIGQREPYKTLRDALTEKLAWPFRKFSSLFTRHGVHRSAFDSSLNSGLSTLDSSTIWALKDVSFEVRQGEVIGIIGRNGAGKTTLLKILSRITEPTEGHAQIHGRVGSLLEVGTGFHAELTGRENIFLNGAILGMRWAEIKRKFDEIVDFSGVEKFIDTPVKRYSSGMQVRLAFSVAAHMEPEILLVDEVLAVGDSEFQKKCLGKMKDVTKQGRTILFVSHNMAAIRNLCERSLLIDLGGVELDTNTERVIAKYLNRNLVKRAVISSKEIEEKVEGVINRHSPSIRFREIALIDQQGLPRNTFQSDEEIGIAVTYECFTTVSELRIMLNIVDGQNEAILITQNVDDMNYKQFYRQEPGIYKSFCVFPKDLFGEKQFYITVHLSYGTVEHLVLDKILCFDVTFDGYNNIHYGSGKNTFIRPRLRWRTENLSIADRCYRAR